MSDLRDDVLAAIDIVDVVSRYVELKKRWSNYFGLSPFKQEKNPSFAVSPDKQIFKDFSSGVGGNAITFVMEMEKIEYRDALKMLAGQARIDIAAYQKSYNKDEKAWQHKEKKKHINKLVAWFFAETLRTTPFAMDYLVERGMKGEQIDFWWLWYAPDSYYDLVQFLQKKWFSDDDMVAVWVAKKWSKWDMYSFFRKRVIFPIYDHMSNLVAFAWRVTDPEDNPKYLNTWETSLYDKSKVLYGLNHAKESIRKKDMVLVVEWYMDVIAVQALYSYPIAVASCGTSLTDYHVKMLARHTQRIYLAFDTDDAWINATIRALWMCYEHAIYPHVIVLPDEYKDIDEYVQWLPQQLGDHNIPTDRTAQEWCIYVLAMLERKYGMDTPQWRSRSLEILRDMMMHIQDYSALMLYIEQIAEHVWVHASSLLSQYKSYARSKTYRRPSQSKSESDGSDPLVPLVALFTEDMGGTYSDPVRYEIYKEIYGLALSHGIIDAAVYSSEQLAEHQLIRENTLLDLDETKKKQTVDAYLQKQLQWVVRRMLKLKELDREKKNMLLALHKRLAQS